MNIELKHPSIVLLGTWNPAIFSSASWIARNIFEYAPGETVTGKEVTITDSNNRNKGILFFEDVGVYP